MELLKKDVREFRLEISPGALGGQRVTRETKTAFVFSDAADVDPDALFLFLLLLLLW